MMPPKIRELLGLPTGDDYTADDIKNRCVEMVCHALAIKKPSTIVRDVILALTYDVPYAAEFSPTRMISFIGIMAMGAGSFHRSDSEATVIRDDKAFDDAMSLLSYIVDSHSAKKRYLESARLNYLQGKEKADSQPV